ncbi:anion transporter [Candidatus Acetothermia bacterium]|nr:anion transporter [Candidatus Acetothermia bacterium]MBI3642847.1 anion transporter [Candidatus Acetothermia bacterium]
MFWSSVIVILLTLIGVAIGRFRWFSMNRATIAVVGATALVVLGAISLDAAYKSIDLSTIVLLFAMMILNANLRLAGFFDLVATKLAGLAHSPQILLMVTIFISGLLSAFFLNDTIVLVFTPLVIQWTRAMRLNPIPYLIALVTAANVGSSATIIGNPQNMLIGAASAIPFTTFAGYLAPPAILGLAVIWGVIILVYRGKLTSKEPIKIDERRYRVHTPLLQRSLVATAALVVLLFAGVQVSLAAMTSASLLLITRRLKPERVFREIDWSLLIFFSGLFVVTAAVEQLGLSEKLFSWANALLQQGVGGLAVFSALLSNLVSNVPAVLLLRPVVSAMSDPDRAWLTLAMATTFAGNLTLLGSVANLIVAEVARRHGAILTFSEYLKAGILITFITLTVGILWLMLI